MPSLMKARSGVLNSNVGGNALAPLFSTGSLTTANLITDVTRLAGVQGDGAAYPDSSVGVWPAATNLCTNGGFESDSTDWDTYTDSGVATVTRTNTYAKFGSYSLRFDADGDSAGQQTYGPAAAASVSTAYTGSCWVYSATGGESVQVRLNWLLSGAYVSGNAGSATVLSAGVWTRLTVTATSPGAGINQVQPLLVSTAAAAVQVWLDGVQLEAGSIATPYIETDGGTASRSAPTISTSFNGVTTSGWVAMRLRAGRASTVVNALDKILFTLKESANVRFEVAEFASHGDRFYTRAVDAGGISIVYLDVGTDLAGSFAVGDAQTIIGYWANGGNVGLSYNGSNFLTAANARTISAPTELFIGQWHLGGYNPAVDYKWLAVGKGTLSNADAALLHAFGNNDPLPHTFPKSAQLSFLAHFNGDGTFYRRSA